MRYNPFEVALPMSFPSHSERGTRSSDQYDEPGRGRLKWEGYSYISKASANSLQLIGTDRCLITDTMLFYFLCNFGYVYQGIKPTLYLLHKCLRDTARRSVRLVEELNFKGPDF